jgi:hypothetical protein
MFGSAYADSWNRNPSIGKARAPPRLGRSDMHPDDGLAAWGGAPGEEYAAADAALRRRKIRVAGGWPALRKRHIG